VHARLQVSFLQSGGLTKTVLKKTNAHKLTVKVGKLNCPLPV